MYSYQMVSTVTDDGAKVVKLICQLPGKVPIGAVRPEDWNVFVSRKSPTGEVIQLPTAFFSMETAPAAGYRTVTAAYASDAKGVPQAVGDCVTLELDPGDPQAGAIAQKGMQNYFVRCDYRITQLQPVAGLSGLVFDECAAELCPEVDRWTNVPAAEDGGLGYGYYTPETGEGERPLIVWLHGAGEGGDDPRIAYMANNVVNLSRETIQGYFGGAYVLAPQTPTFWMNDGSGTYGRTSRSMYVEALKALIDTFAAEHPVDRNRICIGGCSNGGFMTIRMLLDYPGFFAAAYPMCEAFYDENISDEQIKVLAKEHIWFVHAMNDPLVIPDQTVVPTYRRLMEAGAEEVHFHFINDNAPFPFVGHGCWVPGLRDEITQDFTGRPVLVDGKPATLFRWLAAQKK